MGEGGGGVIPSIKFLGCHNFTNFQNKLPGSSDMTAFGKRSLKNRKIVL